MEPIHNLKTVSEGDVLHHPALGFAVVEQIDRGDGAVGLRWERPGKHHPTRASEGALTKGYRRCREGGFLARSVLEPEVIQQLALAEPASALKLLLADLSEPQRRRDINEWLTGRGILAEDGFERWWKNLKALTREDPTFQWDKQAVYLRALTDDLPLDDEEDEPTPSLETLLGGFGDLHEDAKEQLLEHLPPVARVRLLAKALDDRDAALVAQLLALRVAIPEGRVGEVRDLGLTGNAEMLARLVILEDDETIAAITTTLGEDEGRDLALRVLETMSRSNRVRAILNLLEHSLNGDQPVAVARFLRDALPEGAKTDLEREIPRPSTISTPFEVPNHILHFWPRAALWLRSDPREETVDIEVDESGLLLRNQPPIPRYRVLPLHAAIVRELVDRHAQGEFGGLPGARIQPGGRVVLGHPEASDARRDVRETVQLLLELMVGPLPRSQPMDPIILLKHLALLTDDTPPDWLAVAIGAAASSKHQCPSSALSMLRALERAHATARIREQSPGVATASWDIGFDTHIGAMKSRMGQVNQDALFWSLDHQVGLLLVADGISVSTAGSGDLASAILVQVVSSLWEQQKTKLAKADTGTVRAFFDTALASANQAICEGSLRLAKGDLSRHIPMGTTVVLALLQNNVAHIASLGDSPAFLVTEDGPALLTGDQNVRFEWLRSWQRGKPMDLVGEGHALVAYCGHFDDAGNSMPCPVVHRRVTVLPGEMLVLCSDGLTDYASDDLCETATFLSEARTKPMPAAARYLVDKANEGGGGDNVTVITALLLEH